MSKVIRVVPVPANEGMAAKTRGTAVYVGEERIKGVQKLTLIAEPNNVWRATIEAIVQLDGEVAAELTAPPKPPTPPPSRLLCDACGDVTHKPHGWFCRLMARLDGRTKQQADERSEA